MPGFLSSLPVSPENAKQLLDQLEEWAQKCWRNDEEAPLVGVELDLSKPWLPPKSENTANLGGELVRPPGLTYRISPFQGDNRQRARLERPVYTGLDRGASQVYAARMLPEAKGDGEIIIKLYQASYNREVAHDGRKPTTTPADIEDELTTFRDEAKAYRKLVHLQGSVVPHIRGFFEVELPHGEDTVALVMEYVQGTTDLPQGLDRSYETLDTVMDRLILAVKNMLTFDVIPCEIDVRHVIWPAPSRANVVPQPVFIDFNSKCPPEDLEDQARQRRLQRLLQLLPYYRFTRLHIHRWIVENIKLDKDLRQFAITDELSCSNVLELAMSLVDASEDSFPEIQVVRPHRDGSD